MSKINIIFAGDFVARTNRAQELVASGNYLRFFNEVKTILNNSDYAIVNFEAPIVEDETILPIEKTGPNLKMKAKALSVVKEIGFDAVTLANNHFLDYGEEGVSATIEECKKQEIDYVGAGKNLEDAQKILYKVVKDKTFAIVNICESEWSIATKDKAGAAPIDPINNYYQIKEARKKADYVIVVTHGGHEMYQLPSPQMKDLFHFYIEIGVDAVINHHQHCFSGYEMFKGKPIFYGLGNFWFDKEGFRNSIWNDGYMVNLSFDAEIGFEIIPYHQCNENLDVTLLDDAEKSDFEKKLFRLNNIICDDNLLNDEFCKMAQKRSKQFETLFEPYDNRYLKKLFALGFLPSFFNKTKRLQMLNAIRCEAHYNVLRKFLEK